MFKTVTFLTSLALASIVHSAPPSPDSVDTLLAATRAEEHVNEMLTSVDQLMWQSMAAAMQDQHLSPEQQRAVDTTRTKLLEVLRDELAWDKMHPIFVQIYQESFSQEEVDGLIAFYKSPAGVAFIEKMPVVMQKSMSIMQSRIAPLMEKMKAAMRQPTAEVKATK